MDEFLEKLQEDQRRMRKYLRAKGFRFRAMGEALADCARSGGRAFIVGEPPLDLLTQVIGREYFPHLSVVLIDDPEETAAELTEADVLLTFLFEGKHKRVRRLLERARARHATVLIIGGLAARTKTTKRQAEVLITLPTRGIKTIVESSFICARILARVSRASLSVPEEAETSGRTSKSARASRSSSRRSSKSEASKSEASKSEASKSEASERPSERIARRKKKKKKLKPSVLEMPALSPDDLASSPPPEVPLSEMTVERLPSDSAPEEAPKRRKRSKPKRPAQPVNHHRTMELEPEELAELQEDPNLDLDLEELEELEAELADADDADGGGDLDADLDDLNLDDGELDDGDLDDGDLDDANLDDANLDGDLDELEELDAEQAAKLEAADAALEANLDALGAQPDEGADLEGFSDVDLDDDDLDDDLSDMDLRSGETFEGDAPFGGDAPFSGDVDLDALRPVDPSDEVRDPISRGEDGALAPLSSSSPMSTRSEHVDLPDAPVGLVSHVDAPDRGPTFGSDILLGSDVSVVEAPISTGPISFEDDFLSDLEVPRPAPGSASGQSEDAISSRMVSARFSVRDCTIRWGRGGFPDDTSPAHTLIDFDGWQALFLLDHDDEAAATLQIEDELWVRIEVPAFLEPILTRARILDLTGSAGNGGTTATLRFSEIEAGTRRKLELAAAARK